MISPAIMVGGLDIYYSLIPIEFMLGNECNTSLYLSYLIIHIYCYRATESYSEQHDHIILCVSTNNKYNVLHQIVFT